MRIRGLVVAFLLLVAAAPLLSASEKAPQVRTLDFSSLGSSAAAEAPAGFLGNVPAPASVKAERLTPAQLKDTGGSGIGHLVLDRETYDQAKGDSALGRAIAAFATQRPVTVLGAQASDLGVVRGADVPIQPAAYHATTVVKIGGVTFEATHAWDSDPGERAILEARAWWSKLKADYAAGLYTAAESYSGYDWSLKYSTSYKYTLHPYGALGYRADFYRSVGDTSSSYDYWAVVFDQTTDPGVNIWGTAWHNGYGHVTGKIDTYRADHILTDWAPGTRTDVTHIDWWMGIPDSHGGPDTMSNSYYAGAAVDSYQNSNSGQYSTSHRFDDFGAFSAKGYTSEPGMVVRINQGTCIKVPYKNTAEWLSYATWTYTSTWIDSWREVCP